MLAINALWIEGMWFWLGQKSENMIILFWLILIWGEGGEIGCSSGFAG